MTQQTTSAISHAAPASGSHDKEKSIARFLTIVGEVVGVDDVPADEHFLDVGGDSLAMAIIIDSVAQEFGAEPELDWFFESSTVQELAEQWYERLESALATTD